MFSSQDWAPKAVEANGVVTSEGWFCNCKKPAQRLRTEETGTWFYLCANEDEDLRCVFYITEEDARPREKAASYSPRRQETTKPLRAPLKLKSRTLLSKSAENVPGSVTDYWKRTRMNVDQPTTPPPSKKRKASEDDGGDFGVVIASDITPGGVNSPLKSMKMTDNTSPRGPIAPVPRPNFGTGNGVKAPRTPKTGNSNSFGDSFGKSLATPETPKTPGRDEQIVDLAKEVFNLLRERNITLDDGTTEGLTAVLDKCTKQVAGIFRGRDITRDQLKEKKTEITNLQAKLKSRDDEIVELHIRVEGVERDLVMQKNIVECEKKERKEAEDNCKKFVEEKKELEDQIYELNEQIKLLKGRDAPRKDTDKKAGPVKSIPNKEILSDDDDDDDDEFFEASQQH